MWSRLQKLSKLFKNFKKRSQAKPKAFSTQQIHSSPLASPWINCPKSHLPAHNWCTYPTLSTQPVKTAVYVYSWRTQPAPLKTRSKTWKSPASPKQLALTNLSAISTNSKTNAHSQRSMTHSWLTSESTKCCLSSLAMNSTPIRSTPCPLRSTTCQKKSCRNNSTKRHRLPSSWWAMALTTVLKSAELARKRVTSRSTCSKLLLKRLPTLPATKATVSISHRSAKSLWRLRGHLNCQSSTNSPQKT